MQEETINILIERITFSNPQNGYSVLKGTTKGHRGEITVVGNFGPIHPGEEIKSLGIWTHHPQHGAQFQSLKYSLLKPATLKGIEKYLGSGLIKGVGPVTAKRLVAAFGVDSLDIIETQPEKLVSCEGIGPHRAQIIVQGWKLQKAVQDVMIFLQGHGISTAYAVRIFRTLGDQAIEKVGANPYLLAHEIRGIGFKTADKIAGEFGITGADPRRLNAGILYVLSSALDEGHLFLPRDDLIKRSIEILEVADEGPLQSSITHQIDEKRLIARPLPDRELIYLPFAYWSEQGSVDRIAGLLKPAPPMEREKLLLAIEQSIQRGQVTFSDQQQYAVQLSLQEKFMILTGGPGTGKTTTLRALVKAHLLTGKKVLLASPTGRAAKRLSEVTQRQAFTIHRLLEFSPNENGFKKNRDNPLDCDTLVIDEASMIDMDLFHAVLKAIPPQATLILVGDVDQLPSVGPGMVMRSLIQSSVIPVVRLDTIFRQAQASLIITNAHRINRGEFPVLIKPDGQTKTDCYYLDAPDPETALSLLKNVVSSSLPKRFNLNPIEDIQVLTPMNRGNLGRTNLNQVLQATLNPPDPQKAEIQHMSRIFRVGDKVIQMRNNYDLDVFNGDIGFIRNINNEDQELSIEYPQGERTYQATDLLDLAHAYAITVHKSQGSEYPAVVLLVSTSHFMMLQRNLLYTGMTRAKKTLVLIGSKRALAIALKNDKVKERNTMFRELLSERYSKEKSEIIS